MMAKGTKKLKIEVGILTTYPSVAAATEQYHSARFLISPQTIPKK
jgi:hypothetical protein